MESQEQWVSRLDCLKVIWIIGLYEHRRGNGKWNLTAVFPNNPPLLNSMVLVERAVECQSWKSLRDHKTQSFHLQSENREAREG